MTLKTSEVVYVTSGSVDTSGLVEQVVYAADKVALDLKINDSDQVNALGAVDGADPDGRETFAPALITSMQSRKKSGVTLREILGRNYDSSNDAATVFNAFIPEIAAAGFTISDPDNTKVLLESPLYVVENMKMELGLGTTLMKGFVSAGSVGMITQSDYSQKVNGFSIKGGNYTTVDVNQTGKMVSLHGDSWTLDGLNVTEFYGGQAFVFSGDDIKIQNTNAVSKTSAYGTGAFRMVGGKGFRGTNLTGYAGDDIFQFVPISGSAAVNYDLSIEDSFYIGCRGYSAAARLLIAGIAGPQDENLMTCTIKNVGWIGCSGGGTNSSVVIENTEGAPGGNRQIDKVFLSDVSIDASLEDDQRDSSMFITSSYDGGIGEVLLNNVTTKGTPRRAALRVAAVGSEVVVRDSDLSAQSSAVEASGNKKITVDGGRLGIVDSGGAGSAGHVISIEAVATDTKVTLKGSVELYGIEDTKAGVRLSSSTSRLRVESAEFSKASGATGSFAVSMAPGATTYIDDIEGDFDTEVTGGGTVTRNTTA